MRSVVILLVLVGLMEAARSVSLSAPDLAATGHDAGIALAFGFLLLAALYAGQLMRAINVPQLTGYIAVGVLAGPFALDLVEPAMTAPLGLVSDVAVCLIALTAGGELSLKRMRPLMRTIRAMTIAAVFGTGLALTLTAFVLQSFIPALDGIGVGAALAMSAVMAAILVSQSPAVVMALISETRADGPVSQTMLALVVIADLVVIVLYALVAPLATVALGGGADVASAFGQVAWEILGSAGIGALIGMVLSLFLRHVQRGGVLFALLVCVVVAEVGARVHLDPLIVMLVAGVYLENVSKLDASRFIHSLEAGSLPVYLVFFALVGAELELDRVWAVIVPATILALVRGVGFWWGCRSAARRAGADETVRSWVWVGMLPQAGLALALAGVLERSFPGLGADAAALILGVVALNQVVTPILLRIALVRSGEAGRRSDNH